MGEGIRENGGSEDMDMYAICMGVPGPCKGEDGNDDFRHVRIGN